MAPKQRTTSENTSHPQPRTSCASPDETMGDWERVNARTGKCDVCTKRNTNLNMLLCKECGWQTCHSTCHTDPRCKHGRLDRQCIHECGCNPHGDGDLNPDTRNRRPVSVNAATRRPRSTSVSASERAGGQTGSSAATGTGRTTRSSVSRRAICPTPPPQTVLTTGRPRTRASQYNIRGGISSTRTPRQSDSLSSRAGPDTVRPAHNSSIESDCNDDASSSGSDIPYDIGRAHSSTVSPLSSPPSSPDWKDDPSHVERNHPQLAQADQGSTNDRSSTFLQTPAGRNSEDTGLTQENSPHIYINVTADILEGARILLQISRQTPAMVDANLTGGGDGCTCNLHGYASARVKMDRDEPEKRNISHVKTPSNLVGREMHGETDSYDGDENGETEDTLNDSDPDYNEEEMEIYKNSGRDYPKRH